MVIDTSALLAILLNEPKREVCLEALEAEDGDLLISAGTLTESLVTSARKGVANGMIALIRALQPTVVPVGEEEAWLALEAHQRWGAGRHPAGLNFGDCFAYVAAKSLKCPLLFVGDDFSQTDIGPALSHSG